MAITDSFIGESTEAAAVDTKLSTVQLVWLNQEKSAHVLQKVYTNENWWKNKLIEFTWRWSSCCCCPICCWEVDIIDMSIPGIITELPLWYDIDEVPGMPYTSSSGKSWLYSSVDMIAGLPRSAKRTNCTSSYCKQREKRSLLLLEKQQ